MIGIYICSGVIILMSFICFILYYVDKQKAIKNEWRISEKALLLTGLFGGALGGLLGMRTFRHKTNHMYFWVLNSLFFFIHLGIFCLIGKYYLYNS